MNQRSVSDDAKAVVRRNTEEVQGKGRFEIFEELFADDFVDHTTQPGTAMTQTRQALGSYMLRYVRPSPIFTPKSTGSLRTETV